jgi:hypothetical protein
VVDALYARSIPGYDPEPLQAKKRSLRSRLKHAAYYIEAPFGLERIGGLREPETAGTFYRIVSRAKDERT